MHSFTAVLEIIGVNPYVRVPEKILFAILKTHGKDKGPVPVRGEVNGKPYTQTLVRFHGLWRLYINLKMLKNSPKRIGEVIEVAIEPVVANRLGDLRRACREEIQAHLAARIGGVVGNRARLAIAHRPHGRDIHLPALQRHFHAFRAVSSIGVAPSAVPGAAAIPANMLDMPIEELDLPMRAYNSLKRNNIVKVGQLLQLKDDDLLRMRNFGKKSLDEMKERLRMRGFLPPDDGTDGADYDAEDALDDLPMDEEEE